MVFVPLGPLADLHEDEIFSLLPQPVRNLTRHDLPHRLFCELQLRGFPTTTAEPENPQSEQGQKKGIPMYHLVALLISRPSSRRFPEFHRDQFADQGS